MLTAEEKAKIIKEYQVHNFDSGSPEVQVAILSEEIKKLVFHLKSHPKDFHSKRGLLKMIGQRRKLLNYLKKTDLKRYNNLLKKLGIKK